MPVTQFPDEWLAQSVEGLTPERLQEMRADQTARKRFLKEARRKVWSNAKALSRARRQGPAVLAA